MFIVSQPDPDFYKNNSLIFLIFSIILILLTLLVGKEVNGATRLLDLGFFTLQSSEIIKIALPVFLAAYLYDKTLPISLLNTLITLALIIVVANFVRIQPDLGTSLVILIAGLYVLFLAGLDNTTIPIQMWTGLREQLSPTILAVATCLIVLSILILVTAELLRRRSERLRGINR